jgi:Sporulation and spore germination
VTTRTRCARRRLALLTTALAAAVALVGCGVPEDSTDRPVSKAEVEFGLLDPIVTTTSTPTTTTRVPPSSSVPPTTTLPSYWLDFYLIQNQRLVGVRRPTGSKPTVAAVLDALSHPTFEEAVGGRRSELTDPLLVVSAEAKGGSATVELGDGFSALLSSDQLLAIGQIVYSLTEVAGIGSVAFTLGGSPLEVPGADGGLIRGAVSRDDLLSLVATATTTTSVTVVHGV